MTNVLVLQKYNNYFNRTIKKLSTVDDYRNADGANYTDVSNINFNPADGVTTELVLGKGVGAAGDANWFDESDYLVLYTSDGATPPTEVIVSRWFIVDAVRTRGGQHKLTLKRDVIADHFNSLLNCPAFIRKGHVDDDNPLILNDEGMGFNEIKTEETLLKDNTNSAWVVGYLAKDEIRKTTEYQVEEQSLDDSVTLSDISTMTGIDEDTLVEVLQEGKVYHYVNGTFTYKAWINLVDATNHELYVSNIRKDGFALDHTQQGGTNHNPTTDCFCKIPIVNEANLWKYDAGIAGLWFDNQIEANKTALKNDWSAFTGEDYIDASMMAKLFKLANDKTPIYINGIYKKLVITVSDSQVRSFSVSANRVPYSTILTNFYNYYNSQATIDMYDLNLNSGAKFFLNNVHLTEFEAHLEDLSDEDSVSAVKMKFSTTSNICSDQVYDMFAIPANDLQLSGSFRCNGSIAQKLARAVVQQATDKSVYDIQLLPYCPMPEIISNNGVDLSNVTEHYDYDYIYMTDRKRVGGPIADAAWTITAGDPVTGVTQSVLSNVDVLINYWWEAEYPSKLISVTLENIGTATNPHLKLTVTADSAQDIYDAKISLYAFYEKAGETANISIVIYPKKASFSVNIAESLSLKDSMKVEALCNKYRLVSPNYQGSFDFNLAKNGGTCSGFIAECTYKPYTPYIKVAPNFSWMYGTNFSDCRGLICGGDFSLGRTSDAWTEYQLQNKNYQNIFNRDIQNLDITQDIARKQFYAGGILSSFNAGGQGAFTGAMIGGGWGALAGAVTAQSVSLTGLGVDTPMFEQGLHEQRQYAIDKFNYQLGNIKALPYTLTKVGAFDINSKIFPFLEYYTCTPTEKEALEMKLRYEGMTVGIVDILSNYLIEGNGFVQADLIRNETIKVNNHELNEIYNELTKGVYV